MNVRNPTTISRFPIEINGKNDILKSNTVQQHFLLIPMGVHLIHLKWRFYVMLFFSCNTMTLKVLSFIFIHHRKALNRELRVKGTWSKRVLI